MAAVGRLPFLLVSRRWRWMTLAALFSVTVVVRLGFWQLDRLAGRHALSTQLTSRLSLPPITLTGAGLGPDAALSTLEFRQVIAEGVLDHEAEVGLVNQVWEGKLGLHLIAPLVLEGSSRAVLVDRGWIPAEDGTPAHWTRWRTSGVVRIRGWLRRSQPARGQIFSNAPGQEHLIGVLDVQQIEGRAGHPLLSMVVIQAPDAPPLAPGVAPPGVASQSLPYRRPPTADLGNGVHLIAAAQWFIIGVIILLGLCIYVLRHSPPEP